MLCVTSVTGPPGQSIKTRVEASPRLTIAQQHPVRLDNPLKQGLKLSVLIANPDNMDVRLDNPLKQGLKHPSVMIDNQYSMSAWTIH